MNLPARRLSEHEFERALVEDIAEFYDDPLGFVMYAFPWGTGELEGYDGPDEWQRELLESIGSTIKADPMATYRSAVASGHGVGKSALTSWIILWAMSTRAHLSGVVTANTKNQLESKTWRELAVWHRRAINSHWFEWEATRFFQVDHKETWSMRAIPWSETNSEAFAGLHAEHVLVLFDEASAIADVIWEVAEGAMTTPRAMWLTFGNPTRNTGKFRECFGRMKHRWHTMQVDSRKAKMTNKKQLDEWVDDYGEDSDFVRVRIRGVFPRAGSMQFISSESVEAAAREDLPLEVWAGMPRVIGVDVARFGDDQTVITFRQGRKLHWQKAYRGLDTQQVASLVAAEIRQLRPAAVFVDEGGLGAGVVDRLVALGHQIVPVNFGGRAADKDVFYNKRAEMFGRLRAWLDAGADIPDDNELHQDLVGVEYAYTSKEQIILEKKSEMKKRGLASPDKADSLAITFAEEVYLMENHSFEPEESFE